MAENSVFSEQSLPVGPTRANLTLVAGPSNKFPAANCQNRYPSPFKRSGHYLIRPLNLLGRRHWIAYLGDAGKKTFALPYNKRANSGVKTTEKGIRVCKRKFGPSRLRHLFHCQPVVTLPLSRAYWAQVLVQERPSFLVVTQRLAQFWVARPTCFTARTILQSADLIAISNAFLLPKQFNGHQGLAPVAVFVCGRCPLPAPASFKGMANV
ncbi:MAG: hypothetical protein V3U96_04935 [Paracoccaceae bacterium]